MDAGWPKVEEAVAAGWPKEGVEPNVLPNVEVALDEPPGELKPG